MKTWCWKPNNASTVLPLGEWNIVVSVSVCVCVCELISKTICFISTKFLCLLPMVVGWSYNKFCASSFMDYRWCFVHNRPCFGPSGGISILLKRWWHCVIVFVVETVLGEWMSPLCRGCREWSLQCTIVWKLVLAVIVCRGDTGDNFSTALAVVPQVSM